MLLAEQIEIPLYGYDNLNITYKTMNIIYSCFYNVIINDTNRTFQGYDLNSYD